MNRKAIYTILGVVTAALVAALPVLGQETADDRAIMKLIDEALPQWSESVLEVKESSDWTRELDFEGVYRVMGDKPPRVEKIPDRAERLGDDDHMVRLDRGRGKVRYVNLQRSWSFDRHAQTRAVDARKAQDLVTRVAVELGIPKEEIGKARVDTQMVGGAPIGEKELRERYEMYRIVSLQRQVGDLPVYRSQVRAAVSNEGQVQRLMVAWPAFRMPEKLALRSREEVVENAVRAIMAQDPESDLKVDAVLAYAAAAPDDEETLFVPSVVISVMSLPTPYQLVVPVAGTARQTSYTR